MSLQYQPEQPDAPDSAAAEPAIKLPFPVYTVVLIASFTAVAAIQFLVGLNRSIDIAGFVKPLFLHDHEYWRILTGAALHGGLLHLAMNGYAFYSFGRIFELLSNRAHLAIVFLLAAIGGGILSLIMLPGGKAIGASGGIVGLIGYLLVYAFRRREFISAEFRRQLLVNIGFILIFGLVLYQVIDNYGHIGGLITGAVYGLLQIPGDSYTDPRIAGRPAQVMGLVALGIYIATCCFAILVMLSYV